MKVLRKTLEIIEGEGTPYLTVEPRFEEPVKPKRRRKSPVLRKCEELMEALWEDGYHREISWRALRNYVIKMCGGFRTTVTDYLGRRAKYYRSRGRQGILKTPAKEGHLERFGFIEKKSPKIVFLHHERVDRDYHCEQTNIVSFSLTNSPEGNERRDGANAGTNGTTLLLHTQRERETKKFKQTCQRTPESTPEELQILRSASEGRERK